MEIKNSIQTTVQPQTAIVNDQPTESNVINLQPRLPKEDTQNWYDGIKHWYLGNGATAIYIGDEYTPDVHALIRIVVEDSKLIMDSKTKLPKVFKKKVYYENQPITADTNNPGELKAYIKFNNVKFYL